MHADHVRPLSGVRVLDLTNVLSGPFATYQLALLGADIIKVERPGSGDLARRLGADPSLNADNMGTSFMAQNSGKRSITVDLKNAAGREVFDALVRGSDVLVENFRPGVLERLGYPVEILWELRSDLIYCAISGFGATGPLKDRPAYDQIIQGLSGMMHSTGDSESGPLRAGYPIGDTLGGIAAALAISAALYGRSWTGKGAVIDVSMLETALTSMGWVVSNYLLAGQLPEPMGNDNFTAAPSGTFKTRSGLLNISANRQVQFVALCKLLNLNWIISDPRFEDREARKAHRRELNSLIEDALSLRPAAEWECILSNSGVPAGRVLSVPEALDQDQVRARELLHEVPIRTSHTDGASNSHQDTAWILGHGIRINGSVSAPASGPPKLGEHTEDILLEAGFTPEDIKSFRERGGI